MKKFEKFLISVGGLSAFSLPLILASCKQEAKFDQVDDGILKLATGFSETNDQGVAMKAIIAEYNNWLNSGTDEEKLQRVNQGYLPVAIDFLPNGYSTGPLTTKLSAKEQKTFWNIIVNYPTAASILAQYSMNLSLDNETYESLGIAPAFKNVNEEIGGNIQKNEKWVVPFSRSSEMQAVNKVVLGKMLKELKEIEGVQYTEGTNTTLVKKYIDYYESVKESDGKAVDEDWKNAKATDEDSRNKAIKEMNLVLSDDIFTSYAELIKFAIAAKRLYPADLNKAIIGIDSLASAINVMNVSKTKGDKSQQYITPSSAHEITGGYDYESFLEENTAQNTLFKELLQTIFDGIKVGAVWIGGGGSYGSNLLTRHKMAISIGSTAGFTHTFVRDGNQEIKYIGEKPNTVSNEATLSASNEEEKAKGIKLKIKSGKYTNNIFAFNLPEGTTVGRFDKQFSSEEAETTVTTKSTEHPNYELYQLDFDGTNIIFSNNKKYAVQESDRSKVIALGTIFKNDGKKYILIDPSLVQKETITADKLLNKQDADWISAPLTKGKEDKKSVFIQGPSLVLVHANERENNATKLFVKWLFNQNISNISIGRDKKKQNFQNIHAIDAFNQYGNYISPTTTYFQDGNTAHSKLNEANKIAFDNFKLIGKDDKYQAAEDISSVLSDKLRDAIGTAGRNLVGSVAANQVVTFEQFLAKIHELFK